MPEARSNGKANSTEEKRRGSSHVVAIYAVTLYGSILVTLGGLYWAATRLGDLQPVPALCLVGLCGALVLGVMLPTTIRSLWETQHSGVPPIPLMRILRLVAAIGAAGTAVGMMIYGHVPAAIIAAIGGIFLARRWYR